MSDEMVPVSLEDDFSFVCSPDVSCFNQCCRDLNQFLTPYDVLRLKNALGISSHEFLKKYTLRHNGPESGLPVVTFKMDPANGYACPFVTPEGCSVYNDRPASCRMYPLARAVVRSRETGKTEEYFALIEEPHCHGFGGKSGQTVAQWLAGQDVVEHNAMNDKLVEVIGLKNRIMPGPLDGVDGDRFYMASYDLDTFREQICDKGLLSGLPVSAGDIKRAQGDDVALLELGLVWIKYVLFGVPIKAE
ncbi:hypothetical protein SAMN02746065_103225 [Desulfocicer vacuolatum DSM 3385]|uniref:Uncharacterized protein n=1 Tax=Desulfocicer vacuolatum DSM 3385 TaxID=1121400 RepID=A0A1W1ZVF5_9BACT|nr:YkgJ family cysteine cluster protein [Desulfocicer vacuolatum]SMC52410.1 hypothetical protein SAMN02746065_103225 [Desulfocicer vacuolatum DSM 3385]